MLLLERVANHNLLVSHEQQREDYAAERSARRRADEVRAHFLLQQERTSLHVQHSYGDGFHAGLLYAGGKVPGPVVGARH